MNVNTPVKRCIKTAYKTMVLALLAMALVVAVFFDVVFSHASLQPSNINPLIGNPDHWTFRSSFPQLNTHTTPAYGYADLGSTAWQGEPARYLMARDFREHESPWWNPYSASGTVGPETLVDIKFSPWTVLSAYFFNASPNSFDYGLILIYLTGTFCVLLALHRQLGLSLLASTAGACIYLLNGFAAANLNSQNGQAYFFAPVLLLALFAFSRHRNTITWIAVAVTHALLLTITMLPTLILALFACHALNLAWFNMLHRRSPGFTRRLIVHALWLMLAGVTGMLLAAYLWLPVADSFGITDMLTKYQQRSAQHPHQIESLLSAFTPKHFWQSSSQRLHASLYPALGLETDESLIAYTGIFPLLLASFAIPRRLRETSTLVIVSILLLLFSDARIFGLTGFIDHIPIVTNIGIQYFGCLSAIALIVLVAQGVENVRQGNITVIPAMVVLALLVAAFLILYSKFGFVAERPYRQYLKVLLFLIILAMTTVLLLTRRDTDRNEMAVILVCFAVIELCFYMNTVRPLRFSPVDNPPAFIGFLKENIGNARTINIGWSRSLYPEYGEMYGIRQVDTENPGQLPWYRDFYTRHFGSDSWNFLTLGSTVEKGGVILPDTILTTAALDIADVKYMLVVDGAKPYADFFQKKHYPVVYQKDRLTIFENPHHLSTATLVPALLSSAQLPESADFNPSLLATTQDATLLAQARQLGIPVQDQLQNNVAPITGTTTLASYHNTEITLDSASAQAAILALSEVWHPGWKASVDDNPAYIGRINEAFRGIALPAGKHHIRIYYDPASIRYGKWISLATAFVLTCLLLSSIVLSLRSHRVRRSA